MSYLYTLVSRLFTSADVNEPLIEQSTTTVQNTDKANLDVLMDETQKQGENDKITELKRLVARLEARLEDAYIENNVLQNTIDSTKREKDELEVKYTRVCNSNRILRERFLKEPEVTTLFTGLDIMTINQFKNIIPKMDLNEFSDLTNKDKYFNACMFMFVRKFNINNKDYNVNDFIEYVLNNDSLTVGVREYLNSNEHNAQVRRELGNFYEFSKLIAE